LLIGDEMKITIDTQVDTHEDIKKVLHILTGILDPKRDHSDLNTTLAETVDTTNLMSMFADTSAAPQKEIPNTAPDFTSFLNLTRNQRKDDEINQPKVEFF